MSDPAPAEMNKAMFMQLVIMLSSSAMQHLGKIINPMTGKTELNLDAAQATIDMLEMIEAKTRGNLDRDEERLLKTTLTSLKMNYVETASSAPAAKPAEPAPEAKKDDSTSHPDKG
jgi:hypothetical protein